MNGLQKRIQAIEEEYEKVEERLSKATANLNEASHAADENERYCKNRFSTFLTITLFHNVNQIHFIF